MIPACFDCQDPADTEPGADQVGDHDERADLESREASVLYPDDEQTEVSAPDQWTLAAMSGEGEDMEIETPNADPFEGFTRPLHEFVDRECESMLSRLIVELKRRVHENTASNERLKRALGEKLEKTDKPARKTRSDAGTTRRKVEAA